MLHSCAAILPAFNSPAYYLSKGSSSVGASLIAGTPLVATPQLLGAYSFLDESAVVMVDEGAADLEVRWPGARGGRFRSTHSIPTRQSVGTYAAPCRDIPC